MGLYKISIALFFCIEISILILSFVLKSKKLVIVFLIILLSFSYAKFVQNKYEKSFLINEEFYIGKVVSLKEKVKNSNKYILEIKSGNYKNFKILTYTKENLEYGDIVKILGQIEKPDEARNDKRI